MNNWIKLLHIVIIASLLLRSLPSPGIACDNDGSAISEAEREALITALDELGLSFDSSEVQGMDNGDLWRYLDTLTDTQLERLDVVNPSQM